MGFNPTHAARLHTVVGAALFAVALPLSYSHMFSLSRSAVRCRRSAPPPREMGGSLSPLPKGVVQPRGLEPLTSARRDGALPTELREHMKPCKGPLTSHFDRRHHLPQETESWNQAPGRTQPLAGCCLSSRQYIPNYGVYPPICVLENPKRGQISSILKRGIYNRTHALEFGIQRHTGLYTIGAVFPAVRSYRDLKGRPLVTGNRIRTCAYSVALPLYH